MKAPAGRGIGCFAAGTPRVGRARGGPRGADGEKASVEEAVPLGRGASRDPADVGTVSAAEPPPLPPPAALTRSRPRHELRHRHRHRPAAPQLPRGRPRPPRRRRAAGGGVRAGHRYRGNAAPRGRESLCACRAWCPRLSPSSRGCHLCGCPARPAAPQPLCCSGCALLTAFAHRHSLL